MADGEEHNTVPVATDTQIDISRVKLELESEELRLKIEKLKRPEYLSYSFWISVTAAICAIGGMLAQSYYSNIKAQTTELEILKKSKEIDDLKTTLTATKEDLQAKLAQLGDSEQKLLATKTSLASAEDKFLKIKNETDRQTDLAERAAASFEASAEQDARLRESISGAKKLLLKIDEIVGGSGDPGGVRKEVKLLVSQVDDFFFPVEARQWSDAGSRPSETFEADPARFTSEPAGATVYVVPILDWRENKFNIDTSETDLQIWKIGTTEKPLFKKLPSGEGQTYVALFVLKDKRNSSTFQMR